jgi:outer membrane protein assembly factor BamB
VDGGPRLAPDAAIYVGADGLYRVGTDGQVQWRYPALDAGTAEHVFSDPLVLSDQVVFGTQAGEVRSVSHAGELLWSFAVGADVDGSPVQLADGTVVVGADDGHLYALSLDGRLLWTFAAQKDIRAAVGVGRDGSIFVPSYDGFLYALGPTGAPRWKLPTGAPVAAPVVVDAADHAFVASRSGRLFALAPSGSVLWTVAFTGELDGGVALVPDGSLVIATSEGVVAGLR